MEKIRKKTRGDELTTLVFSGLKEYNQVYTHKQKASITQRNISIRR